MAGSEYLERECISVSRSVGDKHTLQRDANNEGQFLSPVADFGLAVNVCENLPTVG
jgi:hypothetical protein